MRRLKAFSLFILLFSLSACVTVGPYPSQEELKETSSQLRRKALIYRIQRTLRVNNVGFQILKSLNPQKGRPYNYSGLLVADLDGDLASLFNRQRKNGVVVYGVVKNSPAFGKFQAGDVILRINHQVISDVLDYYRILAQNKINTWRLTIERKGQKLSLKLKLLKVGYPLHFSVVASQSVNAAASGNLVIVTYGLLNFVRNDDELAVVIGHEIAHIVRGHLLKRQGIDFIAALIAFGISQGLSDKIRQSSRIGSHLGGMFDAKFSRDFEREADYFGIIFAYLAGFDVEKGIAVWERFAIELPQSLNASLLADHPTTTERLLRVKDLVKKLKSGQIDLNKIKY